MEELSVVIIIQIIVSVMYISYLEKTIIDNNLSKLIIEESNKY